MDAQVLTSTKQVLKALGGFAVVAKLTKSKYSAVGNWDYTNKFPAKTYVVLQRELARLGFTAPDELWGMSPPTS